MSNTEKRFEVVTDSSGFIQCGVSPDPIHVLDRTEHQGECLEACAVSPGCSAYNYFYDSSRCELFCMPTQYAVVENCFNYVVRMEYFIIIIRCEIETQSGFNGSFFIDLNNMEYNNWLFLYLWRFDLYNAWVLFFLCCLRLFSGRMINHIKLESKRISPQSWQWAKLWAFISIFFKTTTSYWISMDNIIFLTIFKMYDFKLVFF